MSDQHSEPSLPVSAAGTHRAVRAAFVSFVELEYPALKTFLLRCGASYEDSEDAAQEAFLDAWRLLISHPSRWVAIRIPRAWVRTVALRALVRPRGQVRRQVPTIPIDLDQVQHDQVGGDWAEQVALESDVRAALLTLPWEQKLAMAYRLDEFTHSTIAEQLGVTEQRARDLVKQARASLKISLRAHSGDEKRAGGHLGSQPRGRADD